MRVEKIIAPVYSSNAAGDAFIDMSIQCLACKHLNNNMTTCRAFPKGIPTKILVGRFDHTRPYKKDNGIQFERTQ